MIANLTLGTAVISTTVLIHTAGIIFLTRTIGAIIRRGRLHRHHLGRTVAMVATVLGLFLVHTIEYGYGP